MIIRYTSTFAKRYRKLPPRIRKLAPKRENIFRKNPMDPRLKTHALTGKLKGYFAFSITLRYRILFIFEPDGSVTFIGVGTHTIYR